MVVTLWKLSVFSLIIGGRILYVSIRTSLLILYFLIIVGFLYQFLKDLC